VQLGDQMIVWFKGRMDSFSQNNSNKSKKGVGYGGLFVTLMGMQPFMNKP
jgi:hypothetical protein